METRRPFLAAPYPLPGVAAFIYPDRRILPHAHAFDSFNEVVTDKSWQIEQAAGLGGADCSLERAGIDAGLQLVFVDTDDPRHSPPPPVGTPLVGVSSGDWSLNPSLS